MQKYKYTAVNLNKKKFSGTFLAEDEEHLRALLAEQNLYLIKAQPMSDKTPNMFFSVTGKVKTSELTQFCRQFSIMVNAGISIIDSLYVLKGHSYSSYFKKVLELVYEDVQAGVLLSDAFKKHDKVFPEFFYSMAYVGEMSGCLDKILNNLADYYETEAKMKAKTRSALAYPIILLCMTVAIILLMMIFVVPTFKESLVKLEIEMPGITKFIFNLSSFFVKYGLIIVLVLVALIVLVVVLSRTKQGRYFIDSVKLKIPLFGKTQINGVTSKFARALGLLLSSGMDLLDALEIVSKILGNKKIEKTFLDAVEEVKKGQSLTMAFEKYNIFPQILIQMVSVGERTGALDQVLLRACAYFDNEVEASFNALTAALTPIMLVLMGGTICLVFVAVYSPMISIMQNLA